MTRIDLTKEQWIKRYGGQSLLDGEGFEVIPCVNCDDSICHGWRVQKKDRSRYELADIPVNTMAGRRA